MNGSSGKLYDSNGLAADLFGPSFSEPVSRLALPSALPHKTAKGEK